MADQDNPHFDKIFWYIMLMSVISISYLAAVTFLPIPEENRHTVDFAVGFLLGTVVASCIGYLLGGNPVAKGKPATPDNTEVHTTTTSTTVSKPPDTPIIPPVVDTVEVTADNVNVQKTN